MEESGFEVKVSATDCDKSKESEDMNDWTVSYLTLKALNLFVKTSQPKGFFQFEIIINVFVSFF